MKVHRFEDVPNNPALITLDVHLCILGEFLARRLAWAKLPLRWFFKRYPRNSRFLLWLRIGFGRKGQKWLAKALNSCLIARQLADEAARRGYEDQAGAMYVTSARLLQQTYSGLLEYKNRTISVLDMNRLLVEGFSGLGLIKSLPADDREYWEDRLTELMAALLPHVAQFPYRGTDIEIARRAVDSVAANAALMLRYRPHADVRPLPEGHSYVGGVGRVLTAVAHLEMLGGHCEDAIRWLDGTLRREFRQRDDLFYALLLGMSAARRISRMDLHKIWSDRMYETVDAAREKFCSLNGRLTEMERLFLDFHYAINLWDHDVRFAEDLLAVAEMVKSRVLLDELDGCRLNTAASTVMQPNMSPEFIAGSTDSPNSYSDEPPNPVVEGLSEAQLKEVRKLSYFPSMDDGGGFLHFMLDEPLPVSDEEIRRDRETATQEGGFQGSAHPGHPIQIRDALKKDELLIEFLIPRDPYRPNRSCWILVVHPNGFDCRSVYLDAPARNLYMDDQGLIERGPLSDLAAGARAAILQRNDRVARGLLRKLFDYLIQPVIDMGHKPENYRRWIVIGHGPLHLVPLHALIDRDGFYLIQRVSMTSAPSATAWLRMMRSQPLPAKNMLLVGNPKIGDEALPSLFDAEDQVMRIPALFSSSMLCDVMSGTRATKERVSQQLLCSDIAHFATHGELDSLDPMNGQRLRLARSSFDDGKLHAHEIRRMDLTRARLVVLNICNGVVCRYGPGDEPLGLLSAFITAGAENVLGGLWELADAASKIFILDFYQFLREEDPAVARQSAAKRAIHKRRDLVFWAGFELVGPARSIVEAAVGTYPRNLVSAQE